MSRTVLVSNGDPLYALVTGGAGFIGSHVAEALDALGWHVEVLDNLSSGDPANVPPGVPLRIGDIRSHADVRAAFGAAQFDAVVHCAGQTSVVRSMLDPGLDWDVNVMGTRRLAMAAKASEVRRFVFLSSGGAIYGETPTPADEQTMPAPCSYYGLHKYVAEQLLQVEGPPYAILRPSNVYGSRQRSDAEGGVVAIFRQRLLAGEPVDVHGDGQQVRDFILVSDVVGAVLAALATERDVIWNVASGEATSIIELAAAMAEVAGRPIEVRYQPRRPGDVARSLLSDAALRATRLWGPALPLMEGLRLTLAETPEVLPVVPAAPAYQQDSPRPLRPSPRLHLLLGALAGRSPARMQDPPRRG